MCFMWQKSTTVEILLYYLTADALEKYNSIYNSRNSFILLNISGKEWAGQSTTVEILLYYLTFLPMC